MAMPRKARSCPGGYVYHVWNRAAGRLRLFKKDDDFLAMERILIEAHARCPLELLDWCLMPNHWHFVVHPDSDTQVTEFFRWLTHTHSMRWHASRGAVGIGPLYQGRFKTLPVEQDEHLLTLLRYVERNPVRAGLVRRAADWRWGSAGVRHSGRPELRKLLSPWPVEPGRNWSRRVDEPQTQAEVDALPEAVRRSRPYGTRQWTLKIAGDLHLEWTLHPRGRPEKPKPVHQKPWKRATSPLINPKQVTVYRAAGDL
jgi:putative transposase